MESLAKRTIFSVQEFSYLVAGSVRNAFSPPRYVSDTLVQMDTIGVGSIPIVLLTGFFTGAVLALQSYRTLQTFGEVGLLGEAVAISVVRELGPVLTALMVAGRNSSGIASELGSMLVSEQIDAMRALGTDPTQKLVTPRLVGTAIMLPLLTIISDFVGMCGGWFIAATILHLSATQYWTTVWQALAWNDVVQGLLKPLVFAFVVSLVGCYYGLRTTGGTQGGGRSTTQAVVSA